MTDNWKAGVIAGLLGLGVLAASIHDNTPLLLLVGAAMLGTLVWAWRRSEREDEQ